MLVQAYGAHAGDKPLEPMQINRRAPAAHDVQIDIAFCGICHSDLHQVRAEWAGTQFPCVPGHEIVGRVSAVGDHVKNYKVGDLVGVGCIVDSCQHCDDCESGLENYCDGMIGTYNFPTPDAPGWTLGGYSQNIVVHERYVLRIRHPEAQLAAVAPLLCAGITTYSPLRQWRAGPGKKVGVVGIGGLGHLALRFLNAWGCEVTAFTSSLSKQAEAMSLGAHKVVASTDSKALKAIAGTLDFLLVTASADLDWNAMLATLRGKGRLHFVGIVPNAIPTHVFSLIPQQKSLSGSPVGSPSSMATMLEFCARHQILPQVEMFPMSKVNEAVDHLRSGKARYRVVLDASQ